MQVTPVSSFKSNTNNNYNPHFQAKLSLSDIDLLVKEAKMYHDASSLPKLYVLLDYLNEIPGKLAKIKQKKNFNEVIIDGKSVYRTNNKVDDLYSTLKGFLVGNESLKNYIRMPENIFVQKWWSKRNINEKVLEGFAYTPPTKTVSKSSSRKMIQEKPYYVKKENFSTKEEYKGEEIKLSNIEILALEKNENGRAQLDGIAEKLNDKSLKIFNRKREAARTEIENQRKNPKIYKFD